MNFEMESSWKCRLEREFSQPYFSQLVQFVQQEYDNHFCYPKASQIFSAFEHCPFDKVKVVIIGQDPYHGEGQANGLCFSVNEGVKIPPSLKNIFKELKSDLEIETPISGNLERWAKQGVLLLNATLTVRANAAGSHQKRGWENFTDTIIHCINEEKRNVVFMLWGQYAQEKGKFIDTKKQLVLSCAHPSPFSAYNGFFGNKHFSKANAYLHQNGQQIIGW